MSTETTRFTPAELAECARREVAQRRRAYTRLVGLGKMNQRSAEREIAMMEAIHTHFAASDGRLL